MEIGYLARVREDLMEAAERELRAGRRRGAGGLSGRVLIVAGAAGVLAVAGTLGWFLAEGGPGRALRPAITRPTPPPSPRGGTHAVAALGSAPAPAPAPGDQAPEQIDLAVPGGELTRVIRTASLTVVVPPGSFEDRFAQAQEVAERSGGFVQTSTGRERSGSLVMRVPAPRFAAALRDLRALGEVEVQTVRGQDVTSQYVDLAARLRIAKARRAVLLGLMERATTIEQTIRVQNALDDTQLRIEELQGAISLLQDRVAFAAIRLQLREEGVTPEPEVPIPSVLAAWRRAIAGAVAVVAWGTVGLGYLAPVLALAGAAWLLARRLRRRRAP